MPPKKQEKAQAKADEKRKAKIIEDKTFGLKNKNKSKAVQKYIRSVQQQVTGGKVKSDVQIAQEEHEKREQKKAAQKQAALLAALTKGTENMKKIADGVVDPKQIREGQQIDVYVDQRDQKKQETMDDWDQAKLEQVVHSKHGGQRPTCDIVCKYFLDALEKRKYGWFWQCPNGEQCQYKHCLPWGYVLKKKDVDPGEADEDDEPIEEIIERQRAALPSSNSTPVTLESFLAWKKKKKEQAEAATEEANKEKGRMDLSGRDLFTFNPALFVDDAAAIDSQEYLEDELYQRERLRQELDEVEEEAVQRRIERDRHDNEFDDQDKDVEVKKVDGNDSTLRISDESFCAGTATQEEPVIKNRALFLDGEGDVNLDELED